MHKAALCIRRRYFMHKGALCVNVKDFTRCIRLGCVCTAYLWGAFKRRHCE